MTGPDQTHAVPIWLDDLLSAAVLGTDRRLPPDPPPTLLAAPGSILDQAAIAAALRHAGRRPTTAVPTECAPDDELPVAPPRAVELLGVLLDAPPVARDVRTTLICRWLGLAAEHGTRVPPHHLSALMTLADAQPRVLPALHQAWGRRGDWLAAMLTGTGAPPPSRLDAEELARNWENLRTADAVAALRALRATDPDGARSIAAARWASLPADLKEDVLTSWIVGLSDADEAVLEAALGERSLRVRGAAQRVLRRLPHSAYAHRMADRLRPLITVDRPRGRWTKARVTALAPTAIDDAAVRDGLRGVDDAVDRTASLHAIVVSAPLSVWGEVTGLSVDEIVAAVRDDEALLTLLISAACDQHDVAWARALLDVQRTSALLAALPRSERDAYVLRRIPVENDVGFRELLLTDHPWSPAVARAILDRVTRPQPAGARKRATHNPVTDPSAFPAEIVPYLRELLARAELPGADVEISDQLRRVLTATVTYASFDRSIQEAFS
ncbi:DUF5691 domain-containing protein [Gordonia hydrophobica]|uniref:DUF5691 domain-containing protein n=1 Tax=Gordonia hydrophobica TaxID=40516 RepID=A0ABZ2TYQ1_9ACTN|nr:DUF5691 domain-containing protein [Gordonia hydrophobica]MBM7367181.1 hypothetical protein [Gordonia hydrophobica]